jgi:hypothetical protein
MILRSVLISKTRRVTPEAVRLSGAYGQALAHNGSRIKFHFSGMTHNRFDKILEQNP